MKKNWKRAKKKEYKKDTKIENSNKPKNNQVSEEMNKSNIHWRPSQFKSKDKRNAYYRAKSKFNLASPTDAMSSKLNEGVTKESPQPLSPPKTFRLFASCLPGLEPILCMELEALGFTPIESSTSISRKLDLDGSSRIGNDGGIEFEVKNIHQIYQCHLYLGTASHILLRCSTNDKEASDCDGKGYDVIEDETFYFKARLLAELRRKVSKMPCWRYLFHFDNEKQKIKSKNQKQHESKSTSYYSIPPLSIRVSTQKSKLQHTKAISERVEQGIYDALGITPPTSFLSGEQEKDNNTMSSDNEEQNEKIKNQNLVKILVRIQRDNVHISLDTSCTPLHQRGYRFQPGKAPLREDLAFALLKSCGWPWPWPLSSKTKESEANVERIPNKVLLDPFCGSGTIAIEAAAMANHPNPLPPGRFRKAPLQNTSLGNTTLWNDMVQKHTTSAQDGSNKDIVNNITTSYQIVASDRDAGTIHIAKANAERAGVLKMIQFQNCAVSSSPFLQDLHSNANFDFVVATNPPFGKRISPIKKSNRHQNDDDDDDDERSNNPLLPLYQKFGHQLNKLGSVKVALIAKDVDLARRMGLKTNLNVKFVAKHGGLTVSALTN